MFADVKYAIRQLKKSPGFAVTAVLTLALGIGANAVVFSVLNALVLKPLNVPHSQNLYMVQRFQYPSQSYPDYLDLRDRNKSFDWLAITSSAQWGSIPAAIHQRRGRMRRPEITSMHWASSLTWDASFTLPTSTETTAPRLWC